MAINLSTLSGSSLAGQIGATGATGIQGASGVGASGISGSTGPQGASGVGNIYTSQFGPQTGATGATGVVVINGSLRVGDATSVVQGIVDAATGATGSVILTGNLIVDGDVNANRATSVFAKVITGNYYGSTGSYADGAFSAYDSNSNTIYDSYVYRYGSSPNTQTLWEEDYWSVSPGGTSSINDASFYNAYNYMGWYIYNTKPIKFFTNGTTNERERLRIDGYGGVNVVNYLAVGTATGATGATGSITASGPITANTHNIGSNWSMTAATGATGALYIAFNGVNVIKIESNGAITSVDNVTAYGTI